MSDKKYVPPGFDPEKVLAGLHKAMGFGEPTGMSPDGVTAAEATFHFQKLKDEGLEEVDTAGVPYDPDEKRTNIASPKTRTIACAVEFFDAQGSIETFGYAVPTRIKLTILQPEWELVKDFDWVVANGDKYVRGKHEPVIGLGSIDVHIVWCTAEGES